MSSLIFKAVLGTTEDKKIYFLDGSAIKGEGVKGLPLRKKEKKIAASLIWSLKPGDQPQMGFLDIVNFLSLI